MGDVADRVVIAKCRDRQSTLASHRQFLEIVTIVAKNTFTN
jgi:hypothetical protein